MPWHLFAHGSVEYGLDLDPRHVSSSVVWHLAYAGWNAAPSLLMGLVLAGLLEGMVGASAIRRAFGAGRWTGPWRAWAIGLLVPTCSLGALPIARAIRRAGVPPGTVISFLLVAGALNPFSLVFGLSMLGPGPLGLIVAGSLVSSAIVGGVRNLRDAADPADATVPTPTIPSTGLRRLAAAGLAAADDLAGPMGRDLALAALGVALLGAFLPSGWLQLATSPSRPTGPLVLSAAVTPAYVGPVEAMRQAGGSFRDGYPLGIGFVLVVCGAGLNLAVVQGICRLVGRGVFVPTVLVLALYPAAEYAIDALGLRSPPETILHTHALDSYGRSPMTDGSSGAILDRLAELTKSRGPVGWAAIGSIALLAAVGATFRRPEVRARVVGWIEGPATARGRPGAAVGELVIPRAWLIGFAILSAIAAGGALLVIHYPPPEEILEEMDRARTEVIYSVKHDPPDVALGEIRRWEELAEKIEPALLIHRRRQDQAVHDGATELRNSLKMLRELVEAGRVDEAKTTLGYVADMYQACRRAIARP